MSRKAVWTLKAKESLDYYCSLIEIHSPINASKVRKEIVKTSKRLSKSPHLFQIDEYYTGKSGNIRRYFKWSYKIVYQVLEDKVIVLEVYHTSSSPL